MSHPIDNTSEFRLTHPFSSMDDLTYMREANATASCDYEKILTRLSPAMIDMLHGAIGVGGEAGELLDAVKRFLFYGKDLDRTNVIEEVGDVLWYLALILRSAGSSFEEAKELNIKKLKARYAGKFSE